MKQVIGLSIDRAKELLGTDAVVVPTHSGKDVHELQGATCERVLRVRRLPHGYELVTAMFK